MQAHLPVFRAEILGSGEQLALDTAEEQLIWGLDGYFMFNQSIVLVAYLSHMMRMVSLVDFQLFSQDLGMALLNPGNGILNSICITSEGNTLR